MTSSSIWHCVDGIVARIRCRPHPGLSQLGHQPFLDERRTSSSYSHRGRRFQRRYQCAANGTLGLRKIVSLCMTLFALALHPGRADSSPLLYGAVSVIPPLCQATWWPDAFELVRPPSTQATEQLRYMGNVSPVVHHGQHVHCGEATRLRYWCG